MEADTDTRDSDGWPCLKPFAKVVGIAIAATMLLAPSAGAVDRIENMPGANASVYAMTEPDANGVRYLGGSFTAFNEWGTGGGTSTDAITGAVDPAFPRVNGYVFASASDGQGGFYIGGNFSEVDGVARSRVAHINADGSLDLDWNPQPAVVGDVYAMAYSGEEVYIGGNFTMYDQSVGQWNNAAALDPVDGSPAANWNLDLFNSDTVYTLSVEKPDLPLDQTTVFVGGYITSFSASCQHLVKIVGTGPGMWDDNFCPNPDGYVQETAVGSGAVPDSSTVYVGGQFGQAYDPFSSGPLTRLNAFAITSSGGSDDGNLVADWHPNPNSAIHALAVSGSNVYLGGEFTSVDPTLSSPIDINGVAAISTDGDPVGSWNPDVRGGRVQAFSVVGSGATEAVYLAGSFQSVGGTNQQRAAAVRGAGAGGAGQLLDWTPVPGDTVDTIATHGSKAYLGGQFQTAGGTPRSRVAAVGPDGLLTDWNPQVNGMVLAMAVSGSTVYIGGDVNAVDGENPCDENYGAAAISTSGVLDTNWAPCPFHDSDGENGEVNTLDVSPDGSKVYVGGYFDTVLYGTSDEPREYAAAFSPSGAPTFEVQDWNPWPNQEVNALAAAGSVVYLGGDFTQINNGDAPRQHAAAVDDGDGAYLDWNPGFRDPNYETVWSVGLAADDSTVYVGGKFSCLNPSGSCTDPGSIERDNVAAIGAVGQPDSGIPTDWNPGVTLQDPYNSANVADLALGNGSVFLGGTFDAVGTEATNGVGKVALDQPGTPLQWNPSVLRAGGDQPRVLALGASDSTVYLGGDFTEVGGESRLNSAAVSATDASVLAPWPGSPPTPSTTFRLSVSKTGSGAGTVASSPTGIDCGNTCEYDFASSQTVTLTANATSGSTFSGWTGACSGAGACQVTMNQVRSVGAIFTADSPSPPTPPTPPGRAELRMDLGGAERVGAARKFRVGIWLKNRGSGTARQTKTCLTLPKSLWMVWAKGKKAAGHEHCWNRSSLAAGAAVSYKATVRSSGRASGAIRLLTTANGSDATGEEVSAKSRRNVSVVRTKG